MLHPISTPLGLHMGPASLGQQPPSLKRGVGTRCHSSPAVGPAALAQLPLRLGSCLQGGGPLTRHPVAPVARRLPQPTGPRLQWPLWVTERHSHRGGHSLDVPDVSVAQTLPSGLEAAFTCRAAGWPTGSRPGRGPQGAAQGPPRHRELQEAACCPCPLPDPPCWPQVPGVAPMVASMPCLGTSGWTGAVVC